MPTEISKIRRRIRFYGWVQAVGFRYRASKAADMYGATGWVRNEYDDSVTMEIQGTEEQIDNVIAAIERGSYIRIERMEVKKLEVDPEERGFYVKY
ncbi:MAG: acylphosphatase [Clostridia bacterium]|nr:acylphosphatase [Clostridia bacterium]